MKNSSMIIVILLVLVFGVVGIYAVMNKATSDLNIEMVIQDDKAEVSKADDDTMQKDELIEADSEEKMMQKEGAYMPFSPEVLANSVDSKRVLFFYANWCPTCKPADASFTKNLAQIPDDITVIRVNYNDTQTDQIEKDLAKKYGITYQHTFVQIDANGNEVTKWNGGGIDELIKNVK